MNTRNLSSRNTFKPEDFENVSDNVGKLILDVRVIPESASGKAPNTELQDFGFGIKKVEMIPPFDSTAHENASKELMSRLYQLDSDIRTLHPHTVLDTK